MVIAEADSARPDAAGRHIIAAVMAADRWRRAEIAAARREIQAAERERDAASVRDATSHPVLLEQDQAAAA